MCGVFFYYSASSQHVNSLQAYENDISLQLDFLRSFRGQVPMPARRQLQAIFTGSGDSLAASMLAESFSCNVVRSMDPLDLYKNQSMMKKKTVYLVSISGNTISNIRSSMTAPRSVAITANPDSPLAQSCTKTIPLKFPTSGVFTAGSISFLSSALTCISMVKKFRIIQARQIYADAESSASKDRITNKIFILGNMRTYPLAMYCAAKFYEVLGFGVQYARTEQFSHMELFSAKSGDTVILFDDPSDHTTYLAKHLKSAGLCVFQPPLPKNEISQMLFLVFYSQLLPLFTAKRMGQRECHFVLAEKLRDVSNNMIY